MQVVKSKPKPKVEDAIFGSSGGFGFTKVNELFVGRVAMLGFSVSQTLLRNFFRLHCPVIFIF